MSSLGNKEVMSKNIKKYLKLNNKTRQELSSDLNISYSTVSDWVNGVNYPRIDKIELMANYFGISKSDLVEDEKDKEIDVERIVSDLLNAMDSESTLLFSGEPMDEVSKELVKSSMEQTVKMIYALHNQKKVGSQNEKDKNDI